MDLPLFAMAMWAILLVDIQCPRGGPLTWYFYPFISGPAALMSSDIARTYAHFSVAFLSVTVNFIYLHFRFYFSKKTGFFGAEHNLLTHFLLASKIMALLYLQWPHGLFCWWILKVSKVALNLVFLSIYLRTSCTDGC